MTAYSLLEFVHVAAASVYPAVQNVILACRALGLGTCLTTNHFLVEDEVRAIVGLPDAYRVYAMMPIGWPIGRYGRVRRKPLREVTCRDRFGTHWRRRRVIEIGVAVVHATRLRPPIGRRQLQWSKMV